MLFLKNIISESQNSFDQYFNILIIFIFIIYYFMFIFLELVMTNLIIICISVHITKHFIKNLTVFFKKKLIVKLNCNIDYENF